MKQEKNSVPMGDIDSHKGEQPSNREHDWLWLCCIPGFYEADRKKLLKAYSSPGAVRSAAREAASASGKSEAAGTSGKSGAPDLAGNFAFLGEKKRQALFRHAREFCAEEAFDKLKKRGISFMSCTHRDYPKGMMRVTDYPSGLFYMGAIPRHADPLVAIVGARMCTYNGKNQAQALATRLAQNGVGVVSGMAYGIDAKAQAACLDAGQKSYAVLGSGVDVCYPKENRALYARLAQEGGILSEYCPGTQPLPFHFPMRNRLISALADMVVVVEARRKSGTLVTADMALEQGKDVYAFPGRPQDVLSAGCNRLIQQGAGMITDIEEFLELNGYRRSAPKNGEKEKILLATSENILYSSLDSEPKSLQALADLTGLAAQELLRAAGSLQARGLAAEIAKNYYVRTR